MSSCIHGSSDISSAVFIFWSGLVEIFPVDERHVRCDLRHPPITRVVAGAAALGPEERDDAPVGVGILLEKLLLRRSDLPPDLRGHHDGTVGGAVVGDVGDAFRHRSFVSRLAVVAPIRASDDHQKNEGFDQKVHGPHISSIGVAELGSFPVAGSKQIKFSFYLCAIYKNRTDERFSIVQNKSFVKAIDVRNIPRYNQKRKTDHM